MDKKRLGWLSAEICRLTGTKSVKASPKQWLRRKGSPVCKVGIASHRIVSYKIVILKNVRLFFSFFFSPFFFVSHGVASHRIAHRVELNGCQN